MSNIIVPKRFDFYTTARQINQFTFKDEVLDFDYYIEHVDEQMNRLFGTGSNVGNAALADGSYKYSAGNFDDASAESALSGSSDTTVSAGSMQSSVASTSGGGSADWKAQKEAQAKRRKLESALKKCEEEIAKLEARDSEINELLADPSIGTDLAKLRKLTDEQTEIQDKLAALYDEWENVSSELEEL